MPPSLTFVAEFVDGEITRMTTYTESLAKLDIGRGVRLSQHAYRSRMKQKPPAIVAARFENTDGKVLEQYDAKQLTEAAPA
jgi:hypothetical protein